MNVFAPDGLVARKQAGTWTYYTFDQQGNVAQRLDASQTPSTSSVYDAYGVESTTGSPTDCFGYNARWGYLLDRETGLYLCQHRYYDPGAGRWITRDPVGYAGGLNLYSFCLDRPTAWRDISGFGIDKVTVAGLLAADAAGYEGPADDAANNLLAGGQAVGDAISHAADSIEGEVCSVAESGIGPRPQIGDLVARYYGSTNRPDGESWTVYGRGTGENARSILGIPDANQTSRMVIGRLTSDDFEWRPALPLDGNPGGGPELVFKGGPGDRVQVIADFPLLVPYTR